MAPQLRGNKIHKTKISPATPNPWPLNLRSRTASDIAGLFSRPDILPYYLLMVMNVGISYWLLISIDPTKIAGGRLNGYVRAALRGNIASCIGGNQDLFLKCTMELVETSTRGENQFNHMFSGNKFSVLFWFKNYWYIKQSFNSVFMDELPITSFLKIIWITKEFDMFLKKLDFGTIMRMFYWKHVIASIWLTINVFV